MSAVPNVVIYARGTDAEIAEDLAECQQIVELTGEAVAEVATDPPGSMTGWLKANTLLAAGKVGRILMASRRAIPEGIETITQDLAGGRPRIEKRPEDGVENSVADFLSDLRARLS